MSATPDPGAIRAFCETLYAGAEDGWLVLSYPDPTILTAQGKAALCADWFDVARTPWQRIARAASLRAHHHNVYFGVVLQQPDCAPAQFKRSRSATAYSVPGLWVDLDLAYGQHAASTLPQTDDEALAFLDGLPAKPSLIVHSGGGLYGYWLFEEPYRIVTEQERDQVAQLSKAFTHTLVQAGTYKGWTLDALGDLARVLRPPGTINHKYGKLVTVLHQSAQRYNPSDFDWLLPLPAPARAEHQGAGIDGQPDLVAIAAHYGTALVRKSQAELAGAHPQHGSSTGDNFNVHVTKGAWHCWRHGTGGDALALIAVCEGLLACEAAVSGALRGDLFRQVVGIANETFQAGLDLSSHLSSHKVRNGNTPGNPHETSSKRIHALSSLSSQGEWPDIAPEAFYGVAGDLIHTLAPHSESDPVALLLQLLTYYGVVLGRQAYYQVEASRHYAHLFTCLVGPTGKGRKGTAYDHISFYMRSMDTAWTSTNISGGCGSGEGLIYAVRDAVHQREAIREKKRVVGYQDIETDQGVIDKRLLVYESEFAGILKVAAREGNLLSVILRQAWDSGNLRNTVKSSPLRATDAHISVIGHITIDELQRYLTEIEMGNGFANRFLWPLVRRAQMLPDGGAMDTVDVQPLVTRLREAFTKAKKVERMHRDAAATAIWHAVYAPLSEGKPGLVGALLARAEAQVLRLSMLYALLDGTETIGQAHLNAALAVWQYCEESITYIFGTSTGDATADTLLAALEAAYPDGLARKTILVETFQRHLRADELDRVLKLLETYNRITVEQEPRTEGKGRPKHIITSIPSELSELSELTQPSYLSLSNDAVKAMDLSSQTSANLGANLAPKG